MLFFIQKKSYKSKVIRFFFLICIDKFFIYHIPKVIKDLVNKIQAEYEAFAANAAAQVEKGNKAAGTRARKSALELSKLMKEFRKASVEAAK